MEEILVFKTDASEYSNIEALTELLTADGRVKCWNFDFADCDNVFRLVSIGITSDEIRTILAFCNIQANELPD